jgi:LPS-assembly protein
MRPADAKDKKHVKTHIHAEACLPARRRLCSGSVTRRLILALSALSLACPALLRAADRPQMVFSSEQPTFYDGRTKEAVGIGNAQLAYGDLLLTADEIRYSTATKIAVAHGHAILTQGARRLLADTITFNLVDGTYHVENLRMGEYPLILTGSSATGDRRNITLNDAKATYSEPGPFVPTLRADKLVYAPDQKLQAQSASVGIGGMRPITFSLFQQNLKEPLLSYVSLTGGYRASLGAYLESGLHLPVADGFRLGADVGIYTARGLMFGPAASYGNSEGDNTFHGYIRSGFISDHGDRLTDVLGRPVPRNRGYVEWQHQQQITDTVTVAGQFNYWKDSEILRDFRPKEFFAVQEPDTFLESVYTGNNYFVSAFGRFQPNTFNPVQERLPELRFDLLPIMVGPGLTERFSASLAVLREDPPTGGPTIKSTRLDAFYELSRTFAPQPWLTFTPVAGGRVTYYDQATGGRSTYTRTLGEVGFDAALRTSATYDYKNEAWGIDGLRHLMTPRLLYRYIPEANKGQPYLPAIDRQAFSTYLQPLGLGDMRNVDQLHATNTVRLELDNTLQTRDAVYGSRDLMVFNLAADLHLRRAVGESDVSELHNEFAFMPARWLQLDIYNSFAPQTFTMKEFNSGLTIHDGDQWSVRLSSNFLRHELDDYFIEGRRRINEAYEAIARVRYDFRKRRFNEQFYGIRQNLSNLWIVEYAVTLYDGPRRESRFGFNVQVQAIGF